MSSMLHFTPVTNPTMPKIIINTFFHKRQYPTPRLSQVMTRSIKLGSINPKNERHKAPTRLMKGPKFGTEMATMTEKTNFLLLCCVANYVSKESDVMSKNVAKEVQIEAIAFTGQISFQIVITIFSKSNITVNQGLGPKCWETILKQINIFLCLVLAVLE